MRHKLTGDKRKRVIEKIQKLFNRAESKVVDSDGTEGVDHEAQLALETARKLMLQYGLEAHDVETVSVGKDGGPEGNGFTVSLGIANPGEWVKTLAVVIADYFFVRVLYTRSPGDNTHQASFLYYGVSVGAEAAAYAFQSCFNQIRTLSKKYKVDRELWEKHPAQHVFRTWEKYRDLAKEEYRKGIVIGFYQKLKDIERHEKKEVTALAVSYEKIADEFLKDKDINIHKERKPKDKPHTAGGHYLKGLRDSNKVDLVRGMAGKVEDAT